MGNSQGKRGVWTIQIIHLLHLCCAYPHNTPESQLLDLAVTLTNFQRSSSHAPAFIANIPGLVPCEALWQSLHLLKVWTARGCSLCAAG